MKNTKSLTIYIASSFGRNYHGVQLLRDALTLRGHKVLDWTVLSELPPSDLPLYERRRAINGNGFGNVFKFCTEACASCDLVIYYGQAGQDAGFELGVAYNAGVKIFGLRGPLEAPGTMVERGACEWFACVPALMHAIDNLAEASHE